MLRSPWGVRTGRRLRVRAHRLAFASAVTLLLGACAAPQLRPADGTTRDAETAAAETVRLEPGPPPEPDIVPLPVLRQAGAERARQRLAARRRLEAGQGGTAPAPAADVWDRIRVGLALPRPGRPAVAREVDWLRRNQEYLDRMVARARRYLPHIITEVERRGLPSDLALLPVVESAFQPFAYSPAGASGLWQFIRSTGKRYGLRQTWWYDGRRDVLESTRAALDYLEKLNADFDGDWLLAVAAYNSGEGNVQRAIARNRRGGQGLDFWSLSRHLPRETRAYVPKLLAVAEVVADPAAHGLALAPIPDRPYFTTVALDGQIDLGLAAELAGTSLDEIYLLNPGFHRFATDPRGPHRLLVPVQAGARLRTALAVLPPERRVRWTSHHVQRGDTLSTIAQRYRTSVEAISQTNNLRGKTIRAGGRLLVPVAMRDPGRYDLSQDMRRTLARHAGRGTAGIYVVRRGDSLWRIARRHRVPVARLARWNGISTKSVLRPGQRLRVWRKATGAGVTRAAPRRAAAVYRVRNGDSLWRIARRNGVSVAALVRWNALDPSSPLRPGQSLRVSAPESGKAQPAPTRTRGSGLRRVRYTVKRGDSLWHISRRFKVTVKSLQRWNALGGGHALRPGQQLDVYVDRAATLREG